jgi:hypothetical protein
VQPASSPHQGQLLAPRLGPYVLRTCLRLTRHSSLWMNQVYRDVHELAESGVIGRFFVHASVYGAPTRAKHISLSRRNH